LERGVHFTLEVLVVKVNRVDDFGRAARLENLLADDDQPHRSRCSSTDIGLLDQLIRVSPTF